MNKIYKVIWSKVKHQYVVTSEFAHSCTKSTTSRVGRSAAAVLAALVLTTGVCAVPAQAADPTLEELYYEQLNSTVHNDETSSPVVKLVEAPTAVPTAAKDGEQAVDNDTQTGEDGGMTGAADQYTVVNEDGFYASNTKGTHNTLSKDGLWVGGTDDNTGFHVDNDGNVRTTGRVTATSEQGDVIISNGQVSTHNENGTASLSGDGLVIASDKGAAYLGDGQLIVTGGVQAGNVRVNTDGNNTITGLTNTTWDGVTDTPDRAATEGQLGQVQGDLDELNEAAVKYDSDGQGGYTDNVTIGGNVTANSFQNTDGSFSVDANGNVDAETVKSEGMSVVDEDGNTTFQVLSNGDVTAHAVTATTVTGGTIQNADGSFSVDANGNVDAETVKSEGMSVVDEDGNTTFQVLANGDVTAHDVIANSYSNVNGTFVADENGKVTAEKGDIGDVWLSEGNISNVKKITAESGNIGDVKLADGKVTAEKGDIGHVWLSEGNISNVKKITAKSGNIGDVKLADGKVTAEKGDIGDVWLSEGTISHVQNITAESGTIGNVELDDGKVTADKGDIGDVWLSEGNISNVKNIKAESGNIGDVKLADGKVTAQKADIGGVFIKNESIQAGNIKINENGSNEITGLSNTRWNDGTPVDEDRAATEGQLSTVQGYVDDLEKKTQHITHTATDNGHYTTIEDHTNFNSDGSIDAVDGQFRVTSDGGLMLKDEAGNETFRIYNSTGGMEAAKGQFKVNGKTGEVSVGKKGENEYAFTVNKDGDISTSGTLSVSNGKFAVDTDGNTEVDGTMVIQGQTIINANADIKGSLEAAGNKFKVDGNTGEVTAPKGNIGGVILETTDDGKSKVKADKADIGGVIIKDKGIEAGTVQINKGSATDNRVLDVNGNFAVYNDGAFKAAGENFVVKATGDVTANSYRNANGTFTADETGLVTATKAQIDNVTIGGEDPSAAIKVSDDNFIVYNDGAFQAAGRKFLVNNQGEMTAAAATVDNVVIDNNQVTGLSNTTWNPEDPDSIVEDRAATEGQLLDVQGNLDTLAKGAVMYDVDEDGNVTDNVTIDGKM
ncbi:hypothetical protein CJ260_00260, partial [Megasphaera sp. ASD88]|uniref:ESPR-type extended signal peptide-containing protein n=1 Tax=Megasphaera sp. ASD88 TaxID=2027407 RepID=UPI000BDAB462